MGIHASSSMLGSAVSSSTPNDFQPSSHMGVVGSHPVMKFHALPAPPGLAYPAVGIQRALESAIGLPRNSTSALWMLGFLMPADVSSNRMMPLLLSFPREGMLRRRLSQRMTLAPDGP